MKLLSMVNMADLRILDLPSTSGTYATIQMVVKKITEIYKAKPTRNHTLEIIAS